MVAQGVVSLGGEASAWLPAQPYWTDGNGSVWRPAVPKRLTEADAKRFVRRSSTQVAIERTPTGSVVEWLDPASRKDYWDRHVAGHVEDGTGQCVPADDGLTYHVTNWRDQHSHRLILISESCLPRRRFTSPAPEAAPTRDNYV